MSTIISTLKESDDENRVAITPDVAEKLVHKDFQVLVEKGAGEKAFFLIKLMLTLGQRLLVGMTRFQKRT